MALTICAVTVIPAPGAIFPVAHPRAGIMDGRCTVQGRLGEYWKFLMVLVDKYLVRHTEDVACFTLSVSIREQGNEGRRLTLW